MASNVFTKNEILQNLASKGYFIDSYTLDTFLDKWKVEAVFEDEQGSEFYDKDTLDLLLNNLFNTSGDEPKETAQEEVKILKPYVEPKTQPQVQVAPQPQQPPQPQQMQQMQPQMPPPVMPQQVQMPYQMPPVQPYMPYSQNMPQFQQYQQFYQQQNVQYPEPPVKKSKFDDEFKIDDVEAARILNNISLSDGTPLINGIQTTEIDDINLDTPITIEAPKSIEKEPPKMGILEGAMEAAGQTYVKEEPQNDAMPSDEVMSDGDFDDMSLLSESYEAQERFRDYIVSELSKKNVDLTPKNNEFKLDISERTLNMIARTMAKKIAKHVTNLCSSGSNSQIQVEQIKEENKKLELKSKSLEEENKKLRMLLAESNKNLNSYKPSIFGLYKKVTPKNKK